jgi:hypothetical protein
MIAYTKPVPIVNMGMKSLKSSKAYTSMVVLESRILLSCLIEIRALEGVESFDGTTPKASRLSCINWPLN